MHIVCSSNQHYLLFSTCLIISAVIYTRSRKKIGKKFFGKKDLYLINTCIFSSFKMSQPCYIFQLFYNFFYLFRFHINSTFLIFYSFLYLFYFSVLKNGVLIIQLVYHFSTFYNIPSKKSTKLLQRIFHIFKSKEQVSLIFLNFHLSNFEKFRKLISKIRISLRYLFSDVYILNLQKNFSDI